MTLWQEALDLAGLKSLGLTSPALAPDWTNPVATLDRNPIDRLNAAANLTWRAPIAGLLFEGRQHDRLILGDGSPRNAAAIVLRLHPGAYARLVRLYRGVIEGVNDGSPHLRPVPCYFLYTSAKKNSAFAEGEMAAGQSLELTGGSLSIHDRQGQVIDPLAVAAAWEVLLAKFPILEAKQILQPSQGQVSKLAQSDPTHKTVVQVIQPHGMPLASAVARLTNLVSLGPTTTPLGFFGTQANQFALSSGTGPDVTTGLATTGKMGSSLQLPAPAASALKRDFFRILLIDRKDFLLGPAIASDPAHAVEPEPAVRHNEKVKFLLSGSAALGSAAALLSGSPDITLIVAPEMDAKFAVPSDGDHAEWPAYPPAGVGNGNASIDNKLRDQIKLTAMFATPSGDDWNDVLLNIDGVPDQCAVRAFHRIFQSSDADEAHKEASEDRGDGAGAVQAGTATLQLLLKDPLRLKKTPFLATATYTLHVDLVITNRKSESRLFGNLTCSVGAPVTPPVSTASNPFDGSLALRGVCPAGLLGFNRKPQVPFNATDLLLMRPELVGPPTLGLRWPTMSRRESIFAACKGNQWRAQLSGLHVLPDALNSNQKLGSPGCPGGKELDAVAVETSGGLLAYDLARAALRRCLGANARLALLDTAPAWDPPAPPSNGNISGAVLQTVPPVVESPLFSGVNLDSKSESDRLQIMQQALKTVVSSGSYDPAHPLKPALQKEELVREYSSSRYGRRDALRTLSARITAARDLIYIESFAFLDTAYPNAGNLIQLLRNRLLSAPALKVILCLSRESDFGDSFVSYKAWELRQRKLLISGLDASRVVAFHPVGIPGRRLRLTTNLVIIDDLWALIGSSAVRRRSLTFDGSLDTVLFDNQLKDGRGQSIAEFRAHRMAGFLGLDASDPATQTHANLVRLEDAQSAFDVISELVRHEGAGLIEPLWDGKEFLDKFDPSDTLTGTNFQDQANPDGSNSAKISLLAEPPV